MTKHIEYKTQGVCSKEIRFDIEDGIVKNVTFIGGCKGNTQGVGRLAEGMKAEDIVARLKGIKCRDDNSCPNQLAIAVEEALKTM